MSGFGRQHATIEIATDNVNLLSSFLGGFLARPYGRVFIT